MINYVSPLQGYVVVSPICFLSCRSRGTCQVSLSLPHSVDMEGQPLSRLVILSSATARTDADPNSPLFSPSERILAPVVVTGLKIHRDYVTFHTELSHPSLFVVAVSDSGPGSIPLPLRCCLYVLYPGIVPSANMVAGFDVETYVGMNLQTVATVSGYHDAHTLCAICNMFGYSFTCVFVPNTLLRVSM